MRNTYYKLPIGSSDFRKMVTENDFFIDNSLFIKDILDSGCEAILITKPRRWGKSSTKDMLATFFAIEADQNGALLNSSNTILFTGGHINLAEKGHKNLAPLNIALVNDGKYLNYQARYPVISLSFKDVTGISRSEITRGLAKVIQDEFKKHQYLIKSAKLDDIDIKTYNKYLNEIEKMTDISDSLKFLTELLHKYFNKKVFVLIDEYDRAINQLIEKSFSSKNDNIVREVATMVTNILAKVGKDNSHLEKIVLFGIYDAIIKEGSSGFNNLKVYGIQDPGFAHNFGFTDYNVDYLLKSMNLTHHSSHIKSNIRDWYNGYTVPVNDTTAEMRYTPWAVVSYLDEAQRGNLQPKNYWSQTGSATILQELIRSDKDEIIIKLLCLTHYKELELKDDKSLSLLKYSTSDSLKSESLITYLLLNSGYITNVRGKAHYYKLPNHEVKDEFFKLIENILSTEEINNNLLKAFKTLDYNIDEPIADIIAKLRLVNLTPPEKIKKAIEYIIIEDRPGLEKFFKLHPDISCHDERIKYGLLHIAAISGDEGIFNFTKAKCQKQYVKYIHEDTDIDLKGFAIMSGNQQIVDQIINIKQHDVKYKYNLLQKIVPEIRCSKISIKMVKYFTEEILPLFKKKYEFFPEKIAIDLINSGVEVLSKESKFCKSYDEYKQTENLLAHEYESLKHFMIHIAKKPQSHVTTSHRCHDEEHMIAQINITLDFSTMERDYIFGLCEKINSSINDDL